MTKQEAISIYNWLTKETDLTLADYSRSILMKDIVKAYKILKKPLPSWIYDEEKEKKAFGKIQKIAYEIGMAMSRDLQDIFKGVFKNESKNESGDFKIDIGQSYVVTQHRPRD